MQQNIALNLKTIKARGWQISLAWIPSYGKKSGHDLSEFYEGGLEKGGFSKLNLRKVRRRAGGGGGTNIEGLRRGLEGGLEKGGFSRGGLKGSLRRGLKGGLEKELQGGLEKGGT